MMFRFILSLQNETELFVEAKENGLFAAAGCALLTPATTTSQTGWPPQPLRSPLEDVCQLIHLSH